MEGEAAVGGDRGGGDLVEGVDVAGLADEAGVDLVEVPWSSSRRGWSSSR